MRQSAFHGLQLGPGNAALHGELVRQRPPHSCHQGAVGVDHGRGPSGTAEPPPTATFEAAIGPDVS